MSLNLAALRSQYWSRGYAVLPNFLSSDQVSSFKSVLSQAVNERSAKLLYCPRLSETREQTSSSNPAAAGGDPFFDKLTRRIAERKKKRAAQKRGLGAGIAGTEVTGDDIFAMAQQLMAKNKKDSTSATQENEMEEDDEIRGSTLTSNPLGDVIHPREDDALVAAIEEERCNLWVTNEVAEKFIRTDLANRFSPLVQSVTGMRHPAVFSDRPRYQKGYEKPFAYEFAASHIGLDPSSINGENSCCLWIFGDEISELRCPVSVMPNSLSEVGRIYPTLPNTSFSRDFLPVEGHIPHNLALFPQLTERGSKAGEVVSLTGALCTSQEENSNTEGTSSKQTGTRASNNSGGGGSVLIMHPHLMYCLGGNYDPNPHLSWQFNLVDAEARGGGTSLQKRPNRTAPTWFKRWDKDARSSLPNTVTFSDSNYFPSWQTAN